MSTPAPACWRTTSPTESFRQARQAPPSTGCSASVFFRNSTSAGGRIRLPTWVARMRLGIASLSSSTPLIDSQLGVPDVAFAAAGISGLRLLIAGNVVATALDAALEIRIVFDVLEHVRLQPIVLLRNDGVLPRGSSCPRPRTSRTPRPIPRR